MQIHQSLQSLLEEAADRAGRYLSGLEGRPVVPGPEALRALDALAGPLPETGSEPSDVLRLLDDVGSPATVASAGGRYFGFVTGGVLPAALAANWLAGAWDQNGFGYVGSPVAARLEEIVGSWLLELFGLPAGTAFGLVTGATMANFTALAAARQRLLQRQGWDAAADGLFGAPPVDVVVSEEVHASVLKALGMLGLGRNRLTRVPTDDQGRMRAEALPALTARSLVCIQAGNVNTGAFDPAGDIVTRAAEAGAWVHVDGAFGLWALVSPRFADLTKGIVAADSWATDAHKWLNVPYDSGVVFVRDGDSLREALASDAAYLMAGQKREPKDYGPESSRRARGVEIWAVLRSLGRRGVCELVERCCERARAMADRLRQGNVEVLNDVVLNQVLVAFGDDARTRRVIEAVQADGTCWCGGTLWHGRRAMRISLSSWVTGPEDVDRSAAAILRAASRT